MNILDRIKNEKNFHDIKNIFKGLKTSFAKNLSVLIVNLPCNGFGDIVFAMKFSNILRKWYGCDVNILTPQKDGFVSLGENPNNVYQLQGKSKSLQCRRLSKLTPNKKVPKADIIFVAPLQADFDPTISDIQKLLPYATKFNTFFLSEYNDSLRKKIDFHTGIGKNRYGLLFTDIKDSSPLPELKYPYAVVYIQSSFGNYRQCLYNFIKMVSLKYKKNNFELVLPNWVTQSMTRHIFKIVYPHFRKVFIKTKEDSVELEGNPNEKNTLYLRLDIFPLPNKKMVDLMSHSVKDILVTGDQSITDALSCCVDKNIFYQIAPWKKDFAKNLVKEMPNKWLSASKTACGGLESISYRSDYRQFKKDWDFRKRAKPYMDGIFYYTAEKKYGKNKKELSLYEDIARSSKTSISFRNKINSLLK
jgi:hypothetical protein